MDLIKLTKVTKTYRDATTTKALRGVDLTIKKGEMVAIMGPSGSGKSTLMHIVGLLDKPSTGTYNLEGVDVQELDDKGLARVRREKIGFVFQSFNLVPRLSVAQNVELPMIYAGISSAERKARVTKLLKAVGLSERTNFASNQLSGGQMQRVAIARALANDPSVIMADEPTGNLDSKTGQQIMDILIKLHKQGNTIILVTHDPDIAAVAERTIYIKDGEVSKTTRNKR